MLLAVVAAVIAPFLSFARLRPAPPAGVDAVPLPLFLDPTGPVLAPALAGPGAGIATGVLTSAVNTLRNPTFWPFVVVQIIVALYAWLAARAGLFRSLKTAVPAGLGLGVLAAATSTPISYVVFGGTTTGGIALTTAPGREPGVSGHRLIPGLAPGVSRVAYGCAHRGAVLALPAPAARCPVDDRDRAAPHDDDRERRVGRRAAAPGTPRGGDGRGGVGRHGGLSLRGRAVRGPAAQGAGPANRGRPAVSWPLAARWPRSPPARSAGARAAARTLRVARGG